MSAATDLAIKAATLATVLAEKGYKAPDANSLVFMVLRYEPGDGWVRVVPLGFPDEPFGDYCDKAWWLREIEDGRYAGFLFADSNGDVFKVDPPRGVTVVKVA